MKISEIASRFGYKTAGPDAEITAVCSYENIKKGALVPLLGKDTPEEVFTSEAGGFLMNIGAVAPDGAACIMTDDVEMAVVNVLNLLYPVKTPNGKVHKSACVSDTAVIGEGSEIGPMAYVGDGAVIGKRCMIHNNVSIGDGVTIGDDCIIYPNVTLYPGAKLKNRVSIHAGSVIAADGFGYYQRQGQHVKIPHIGGVLLEDDVEIGANTCVDRGKFDDTVIGRGSKIDNQVMVGHNCKLGTGCIMVGQAALAGSTTLGDYVVMGARSGTRDHISICSKTMLAALTGVMSDIETPGIYAGFPHTNRKAWAREQILIRELPEIAKRIAELERKIK